MAEEYNQSEQAGNSAVNNNASPSTLSEILQSQQFHVDQLINFLQLENQAIAIRDAVKIQELATNKMTLIKQIHQTDYLIEQSIRSQGISTEEQQQINSIKQSLIQCDQLNNTNGIALQRAAISMHKLHNLFQEMIGKNELTYDSDGQASSNKTLGSNFEV